MNMLEEKLNEIKKISQKCSNKIKIEEEAFEETFDITQNKNIDLEEYVKEKKNEKILKIQT